MFMHKLFEKFRSKSTRLRRNRRGASAVEFALIIPIFLTMTMGVVEMGRAMFIKSALQFAVEETARHAIVNSGASTATLKEYAENSLANSGANAASATFTVTQEITGSRTYMSIVGTYNFTVIVPLVGLPDITLNAKSRFPIS